MMWVNSIENRAQKKSKQERNKRQKQTQPHVSKINTRIYIKNNIATKEKEKREGKRTNQSDRSVRCTKRRSRLRER